MLKKDGTRLEKRTPEAIAKRRKDMCPKCVYKSMKLDSGLLGRIRFTETCLMLKKLPEPGGMLQQPKWFYDLANIIEDTRNRYENVKQ